MESRGNVGGRLKLVGQGRLDREFDLSQVEIDLTVSTGVRQQSVGLDLATARGRQDGVGFLVTSQTSDVSVMWCNVGVKYNAIVRDSVGFSLSLTTL